MNVEAAASQNIAVRPPIYTVGVANESEENEDESQPTQPQINAGSLSGIEKQFVSLIKDLTQQLTNLEKQLAQAFQQLSTQNPAPPQDSDECPPSTSGQPIYHRYGKIITGAARRHEVDPLLVGAVIRHESGFSPNAVSKAGAMGLMQLMPDTAKSLGVSNAFDPQQNVEAGTKLLRSLLDRYHGQLDLALAAYNAGTGAVDKYGGIPPYPETQAYVRSVMDTYRESALSA